MMLKKKTSMKKGGVKKVKKAPTKKYKVGGVKKYQDPEETKTTTTTPAPEPKPTVAKLMEANIEAGMNKGAARRAAEKELGIRAGVDKSTLITAAGGVLGTLLTSGLLKKRKGGIIKKAKKSTVSYKKGGTKKIMVKGGAKKK
jgi:hypothetical protein